MKKARSDPGLLFLAGRKSRSARLGDLGLRLFLGHALLEHMREIDRVDHQRGEATLARSFGDNLPREGEEKPGALDEQDRQHVFLRKTVNAEDAAIDQFDAGLIDRN